MNENVNLTFTANTGGLTTANNQLESLENTAPRVDSAFRTMGNTLTTTSRRITSSFRPAGNVVQNSAYQIQDFAVQVQGGQSAMLAFSQQAPQFFGAFGAGGAVLGTIIAITTAIAGPFIVSMFDAESQADKLDKAMESLEGTIQLTATGTAFLTDELQALAEKSEEVAEVKLRAKLNDALDASKAAFKIAAESASEFRGIIGEKLIYDENGSLLRSIDLSASNIDKLTKKYGITADEVRELGNLTDQMVSTKSVEDVKALSERISEITNTSAKANKEFVTYTDTLNDATREYNELGTVIDKINSQLEKGVTPDKIITEGEDKEAKKAEESRIARLEREAEREAARNARLEASAIRRAERQAEIEADAIDKGYERAIKATMSEEELINASYDRKLEALRAYYDANQLYASEANDKIYQLEEARALKLEELAAKELKQKQDYEQQKTQATLTALSDVGSAITEMGEENSAAAKIGYAITQGIQVAQAINNANLAYTGMIASAATAAAVAGPAGPAVYAAGQAQAEVVRGIGYTTAGLIAGQSIASFEGGGMTPDGARVGGMDGKGGMLAMLHPNEKVTDLTKSANDTGAGVIVNVNIEGGTGNETVTSTESKDDQGRKIKNIVIQMANDKTSGLMKGIFSNTTAQPKGNR